MITKLEVTGTLPVDKIPPHKRSCAPRYGIIGRWREIFDALEKMPLGQAIVVEHDAEAPQVLHGRLHMALAEQKRTFRLKMAVRDKLAYIYRVE